jgi:hypothetical protein
MISIIPIIPFIPHKKIKSYIKDKMCALIDAFVEVLADHIKGNAL